MIKLIIAGEQPTPPPVKEVLFEFRRHEMARYNKSDEQKAFLIAVDEQRKRYVVMIDGNNHNVEIRRRDLMDLGFSVTIKD